MPNHSTLLFCLSLAGLVAGCGRVAPQAERVENGAANAAMTPAAAALERAAIDAGVIADSAHMSPVGLYRHRHEAGRDSLCIVPGSDGTMWFGLEAMFGENIECHGHGTVRRSGDRLVMNFARSACLIVARYEGDRIMLPGALDVGCERLCSERGTLEGVTFPRVSASASVAADARSVKGSPLCSL